jgi:hypothetical protein
MAVERSKKRRAASGSGNESGVERSQDGNRGKDWLGDNAGFVYLKFLPQVSILESDEWRWTYSGSSKM